MFYFSRSNTAVFLTLLAASAGCTDPPQSAQVDLAASFANDDGKADTARTSQLSQGLQTDSTILGNLQSGVAAYGYVFSAQQGSQIDVNYQGAQGASQLAVYGPFQNAQNPGQLIEQTSGAQQISVDIPTQGNYLLAFAPQSQTQGQYQIDLACQGQACQKQVPQEKCRAGRIYIDGTYIKKNQHWDTCDVVLLRSTVIEQNVKVTIAPGVTVYGEYTGTRAFGNTFLKNRGALVAEGTAENPVRFTALHPEKGWAGLILAGTEQRLSHVVIEKMSVGIELQEGDAALSDIQIEGIGATGSNGTIGLRAGQATSGKLERSLVRGVDYALIFDRTKSFAVSDSVITSNGTGVLIYGGDGRSVTTCSAQIPSAQPASAGGVTIRNSTIARNRYWGVNLTGSGARVQVETTNILNNGAPALHVYGATFNEATYLHGNNIYGNGAAGYAGQAVVSYHQVGTLDLTGNYWNGAIKTRNYCVGQTATQSALVSPAAAGPRLELLSAAVRAAAESL